MENTTHYQTIEQWNDELSEQLIPDSTILMLYLIVGILGNTVVIYIHQCRIEGNYQDRYFIPSLALVDLLSCVFNTCFSFSINMKPVTYNNDIACKIMWFFCMYLTTAAALMLLVIAVQRYQKICKPFGPQMSLNWKRVALLSVAVFSALLSFPCFFFYGPVSVLHPNGITIGKRCTNVRGPWTKTEPLVFKGAIMLVTVGILTSLITLYSLIGRVIYTQIRFRRKNSYQHSPSSKQSHTNVTNETSFTDTEPEKQSTNIKTAEVSSEDGPVTMQEASFASSKEKTKTSVQSKSNASKSKVKTLPGLRLSVIFMLISIIFILSFLPKVGMMIWESRNEKFWVELSKTEIGAYRFLYTLFIVNNIIDPFIYGFFDKRFRNEFKGLFCSRCETTKP